MKLHVDSLQTWIGFLIITCKKILNNEHASLIIISLKKRATVKEHAFMNSYVASALSQVQIEVTIVYVTMCRLNQLKVAASMYIYSKGTIQTWLFITQTVVKRYIVCQKINQVRKLSPINKITFTSFLWTLQLIYMIAPPFTKRRKRTKCNPENYAYSYTCT